MTFGNDKLVKNNAIQGSDLFLFQENFQLSIFHCIIKIIIHLNPNHSNCQSTMKKVYGGFSTYPFKFTIDKNVVTCPELQDGKNVCVRGGRREGSWGKREMGDR
jgi:hypothetical protein